MTAINVRDDLQRSVIELRRRPIAEQQFHALPIPGQENARLAVGADSVALLLPSASRRVEYDIELQHIRARFAVDVEIRHEHYVVRENVAIVQTKSLSSSLELQFLEVVAVLLPGIQELNPDEAARFIHELIDLFRVLEQPGSKAIQGLWGELVVIHQAADPEFLARSWHATPGDKYDFAYEAERIEVKTSSHLRHHRFSLEQLSPPDPIEVIVASLIVIADRKGTTCEDVIDLISTRVEAKTRAQVLRKVIQALGDQWASIARVGFGLADALSSLKWYHARAVPRIVDVPRGISEVKFISNLELAEEASRDSLVRQGPLVSAAVLRGSETAS